MMHHRTGYTRAVVKERRNAEVLAQVKGQRLPHQKSTKLATNLPPNLVQLQSNKSLILFDDTVEQASLVKPKQQRRSDSLETFRAVTLASWISMFLSVHVSVLAHLR